MSQQETINSSQKHRAKWYLQLSVVISVITAIAWDIAVDHPTVTARQALVDHIATISLLIIEPLAPILLGILLRARFTVVFLGLCAAAAIVVADFYVMIAATAPAS